MTGEAGFGWTYVAGAIGFTVGLILAVWLLSLACGWISQRIDERLNAHVEAARKVVLPSQRSDETAVRR